jgi:hypothetical protein
MRRFGTILFLLGAAGFFYCSSQLEILPAVPAGLSIQESLRYPAGRYLVAEYLAAMLGAMGVLFLMFPKGR